jgi:hypothetical protein
MHLRSLWGDQVAAALACGVTPCGEILAVAVADIVGISRSIANHPLVGRETGSGVDRVVQFVFKFRMQLAIQNGTG